MAGVDYTVNGLLSSVKRRVLLPDAQNLYTEEDLIAFMGDELSSTIVPLIHSVQQEYWIYKYDVSLVKNQTNYDIPVRGVVNGLRLVTLIPSGSGQNEVMFPLLRPENTASSTNWLSPYTTSTLYGFYMEDAHIVVFPEQIVNNPVQAVRFRFERQPNQLCSTTAAAQIQNLYGSGVVGVDNIPTDWVINSTAVDIIQGSPQFVSKADDLSLTNVNQGTLQITIPNLPSTAAVGDWVCASGTAPIPQIPVQVFPYLAQAVAVKVLEGMADLEPYRIAAQKLDLMKADLLKVLQPRDMGNVQTIVNQGGLFDAGQFWGWGAGQNTW